MKTDLAFTYRTHSEKRGNRKESFDIFGRESLSFKRVNGAVFVSIVIREKSINLTGCDN